VLLRGVQRTDRRAPHHRGSSSAFSGYASAWAAFATVDNLAGPPGRGDSGPHECSGSSWNFALTLRAPPEIRCSGKTCIVHGPWLIKKK